MKITKEQFAALLNGREYGSEITKDEEKQAKANGLLVIFGYSDDGVILSGVSSDQLGACNGATIYINSSGLFERDCGERDCPHESKLQEQAKTVDAIWDKEGYSWIYKTDLPHVTFDIVDGDEKFCRGIVISMEEAFGIDPALEPHQKRVMQEKVELDEKCVKLQEFLSKKPAISTQEIDLLTDQLHVMVIYSEILRKRIDLF